MTSAASEEPPGVSTRITTAPMCGFFARVLQRLGDGVRSDEVRSEERNVAALAVDHVALDVDERDAVLGAEARGCLRGARLVAQ